MKNIKKALEELRAGHFILVHDCEGREDETDMVAYAKTVTPEHVRRMRRDAGGLICVPFGGEIARALGLPFMSDVLEEAEEKYPLLGQMRGRDLAYDTRSSFSLTVNHRDTYTGIPDIDRALTIRKLGEFAENMPKNPAEEFGKMFRSPGHVHLLISSGLENREGHTELTDALLEMAGLPRASVICEMLSEKTHKARSCSEAQEYADENGLVLLEVEDIKKAYKLK